jgi:5'-nucleotidase / UDP-sugar diphosphatase
MKTIIIFCSAFFLSCGAAFAQPIDTITILHVNDSHASLSPFGPRTTGLNGTRGGIARAVTVIESTKMMEKNVLTLHAGDFSVGDIFYNAYFGVPELQILSAIGLDAMTVGNHEFDLTPATLQQTLDTAFVGGGAFPLLSANCVLDDPSVAGLKKYIQPYTIKTLAHTKIGIFGLTTPTTNEFSQPAPAFIDTNLVPIATAMVDTLEAQGCQVILLLSHLGYTLDSVVASNVPGITMIVGGHDHYVFKTPRMVVNMAGDTIPIVQAGAHYEYIGKIHLAVSAKNVTLLDYTAIPLDATIPEDPTTKATVDQLIAGVEAMFGPMYSQKLTVADDDFIEVADSLTFRGNHDTPVGNLVTDAFRSWTGTDIAIEVGGSTADELYQGPIVGADIFRMIGYGYNTDNGLDYRIATFTLSGAQIIAGLEFGLSDIEENDEYLIQRSGLKYTYNPTLPVYGRVTSAFIGGAPLDTGRIYTVTANEFAADFLPAIGITLGDLDIHTDTTEFLVVSNYVSARDTIVPLMQGRVSAVLTISSVSTVPSAQNALNIYPNPATDHADIQFQLQHPSPVEIKVFAPDGVEVAHFEDALASGTFSSILPTNGLSAGTYYCILTIDNADLKASFVVVK